MTSQSPPPYEAPQTLTPPPFSIEAEQSVLGGLMLDNHSWDNVSDKVQEADFYRRDHRLIFQAIAHLAENGSPFDVITLAEWLEKRGELDNVGGMQYMSTVVTNTPSAANIGSYAAIVRDRAVLRELLQMTNDVAARIHNPEGRTNSEILDEAERRVLEIAERDIRSKTGAQGIKSILTKAVERIDYLFTQDSHITGISTGFDDLDKKTAGLQNSDLIIVAGRPSMGKTTFAMNLAENAALQSGVAVAVFSMEMPGEQLGMRMMSSIGRIDQHRVRTGKLTDDDWPRLTTAVGQLSEARIVIDDTPSLSPGELRSKARRIKREHGLGLIVVDYIQLMQVPGKGDNRTQEISEISRNLKSLAKEMNVPVVALSQLNRGLEQRPNKRPVMSDLRESGAIEQDADVIIFIYRDEVYNEDSPSLGTAEILIRKQRNGPLGMTRLAFLGQYTRFENLDPRSYAGDDE